MITIKQLLEMKVGSKIGGGFVLTVKKTKKAVQLPNKHYIHTVVLFDSTSEMLADFKDPGGAGVYNPMKKGNEYKIIVAEIQQAEPQAGKKLWVDQFSVVRGGSEPEVGYEPGDDYPDWRVTVRGKIRHGLVCAMIPKKEFGPHSNMLVLTDEDKKKIEELAEYIMEGI